MMSIIDMSKTEFPKYISEIEKAILSNDKVQIKLKTHKLKGSALNMEFVKIGEICICIENSINDENALKTNLIDLNNAWIETLKEINQL